MKMNACSDHQDVEDSPDGASDDVPHRQQHTDSDRAAPPMRAISMNTSSPAYMLPNNRMPCETVLATYSMICMSRLDDAQDQAKRILLVPKGEPTPVRAPSRQRP